MYLIMLSKGIFSVYIVIYCVMHNDVKIFNVSYTKQKQRLNEKSKGNSLTACYSKGILRVPWISSETQRQAGKWEAFIVEQREDLRCVLFRGLGMGKLEAG